MIKRQTWYTLRGEVVERTSGPTNFVATSWSVSAASVVMLDVYFVRDVLRLRAKSWMEKQMTKYCLEIEEQRFRQEDRCLTGVLLISLE